MIVNAVAWPLLSYLSLAILLPPCTCTESFPLMASRPTGRTACKPGLGRVQDLQDQDCEPLEIYAWRLEIYAKEVHAAAGREEDTGQAAAGCSSTTGRQVIFKFATPQCTKISPLLSQIQRAMVELHAMDSLKSLLKALGVSIGKLYIETIPLSWQPQPVHSIWTITSDGAYEGLYCCERHL